MWNAYDTESLIALYGLVFIAPFALFYLTGRLMGWFRGL